MNTRLPKRRARRVVSPFRLTVPIRGRDVTLTFTDAESTKGEDYLQTVRRVIDFSDNELPDVVKCADDESCRGSVPSMVLTVRAGDRYVGTFSLYYVNLLRSTDEAMYVSTKFVPAFDGIGPVGSEGFDTTVQSILTQLKGKPLETNWGFKLVIEEWDWPEGFPQRFREPLNTKGWLRGR